MRALISLFAIAASLSLCAEVVHAQAQPQWRTLPNAPVTAGKFEDAFFVTPFVGWVVGASKIYKTTNGGSTWQEQQDTSLGYRSVGFADSLRGWVGTLSGDSTKILFSTTDGGVTWTRQGVGNFVPYGIFFTDANTEP